MQIAHKRAELSHQRLIGTLAALVLLTVFFIVYTLHRRKAQKHLADAHSKLEAAHSELKLAYDQLEETTTAKERIESELRIARDIQMSMVPSVFPEYEELDMYASMTPAKEVGGDLYGYILQNDRLYFAVGDVSGKGVPASLFMAQATRLFRTLATQGMMPAEICTRMNEALSGEDNVSGMFVTFFLGLLDLKTGHLDYCNAGHNPPVIGGGENHGDFLEMIPNAPIGLWSELEFEGEELDCIKGRPLFIYTDGLNEAENQKQEQFSDERLLNILRSTKFNSATQIIETLKAEVEKHRDGAEPNDDLKMMCIRVV
jgi:serine phosphatase RsbU (regulator of sigma subunit)